MSNNNEPVLWQHGSMKLEAIINSFRLPSVSKEVDTPEVTNDSGVSKVEESVFTAMKPSELSSEHKSRVSSGRSALRIETPMQMNLRRFAQFERHLAASTDAHGRVETPQMTRAFDRVQLNQHARPLQRIVPTVRRSGSVCDVRDVTRGERRQLAKKMVNDEDLTKREGVTPASPVVTTPGITRSIDHTTTCSDDSLKVFERDGVPESFEIYNWRYGFVLSCDMINETEEASTVKLEIYTRNGRTWFTATGTVDFGKYALQRIKFAVSKAGETIVRKTSNSDLALFSMSLRVGRKVTLSTSGVLFHRATGAWQLWCDDVGIVFVQPAEVAKFSKRFESEEDTQFFSPLRIVQLTLYAEVYTDDHCVEPLKWNVKHMTVIEEESTRGESLDSAWWPRCAQRLDDLIIERVRERKIFLRSAALPRRNIICDFEQSLIEHAQDLYPDRKYTAIVVPSPRHTSSATADDRWTCIIMGPIQLMVVETEDRIFNWVPFNVLLRHRAISLPSDWEASEADLPYPIRVLEVTAN